ncbi:MAG: PTS mannose transporter subunit IID [Caldisphaera sp.]|jgi:dihydroxyacetone kinase phosphotransfer subunit|nr:MAG: PTS mannose transporter subunit IID [Caldisphaera sp.]
MVGLVIVSHNKKLADSIKEIVEQMIKGKVKIESVGGTSNDPNVLGTDPILIKNAIEKAYDNGVVILGDFGSSILSSKTAINMLNNDIKHNVVIADAPLVEGAFAAAVSASIGGSITDVKKAAEDAKNLRKI